MIHTAHSSLLSLHNKTVLVKPPKPDALNSTGMRGTLRVLAAPERPNGARVEIVLGYPEMSDMNGMPAHEEIILVGEDELATLLASEEAGAFSYTLPRSDGPRRSV